MYKILIVYDVYNSQEGRESQLQNTSKTTQSLYIFFADEFGCSWVMQPNWYSSIKRSYTPFDSENRL